jgi:hypothetical protein
LDHPSFRRGNGDKANPGRIPGLWETLEVVGAAVALAVVGGTKVESSKQLMPLSLLFSDWKLS